MPLFATKPADKTSTDGGKSMTEWFVLWQTAHIVPQPSESAYRGRNFVGEKYAPPKHACGFGSILGEAAPAGLYTLHFGTAQAAAPNRRQTG